jgi:hypothetical protein
VGLSIVGSVLLGAFLGQVCKVFVLLPVIGVVLAGEVARAVYFGLGLARPLWEFALMTTSLQIGYVAVPLFYCVMDMLRREKIQRRQARSEARHQLLRRGTGRRLYELASCCFSLLGLTFNLIQIGETLCRSVFWRITGTLRQSLC